MKKIFLLILVVCGCALLLSCGSEQVDFSEKDSYISQYTNHEIGDALSHQSGSDIIAAPGEEDGVGTDVNTENGNGASSGVVDEKFLIINGLDEYESYISNADLVEGFIDYDMISQFGSFDSFTVPSVLPVKYVGEYWYDIVNENGERYTLHIHHNNFEEPDQPYKAIENANQAVKDTDLRTVSTKEAGVYEKNGIIYFYSAKGELLRIRWDIGSTVLFLKGANLSKEPIDFEKTTEIGRLLKAETAKDALIEMFGENFAK